MSFDLRHTLACIAPHTGSTLTPEQPVPSSQFEQGVTLAWLRGAMWLALAVPTVLFVAVAFNLHRETLAQAQFRVDSAARVSEEHALKVLETNVALLTRVADVLGDAAPAELLAREKQLHEQLVRMAAGLRQLQGIFVIGADGRMVVTNRRFPAPREIDYSDRPAVRHHIANGAQPYFSEVLTSRATGEPFFDMSVRHVRADGSLAHVISASMVPAYFADFYSDLAGKDSGLHIALLRDDGTVLASGPATQAESGKAASAAASITQQPAVGGLREAGTGLVADRQLGRYPVHIVAWMERPAVLAPWYRQMVLLAGFAFPSAVALMYVAWVALQRTRRSLDTLRRLEDETAHRLRVEDVLRQAQKLEALGRLSGGIAHDFNNLLMVVGNNVYLQRRMQPGLADSPQLAAIERAAAAGTKLTRQLLSFSRRQALRPEQVQLQQRLASVLELLVPALGASIPIESQVDADTAPIEVDMAELELALLNLAINARDALPGGGRLHITAANAPVGEPPSLAAATGPAQGYVVISVTDNGQGIAPQDMQRVFEPFFTTKGVGHGTGLGLSQVYGFCTRAGGVATIESRLGEGTTVRLYFPARQQAAAAAQAAPAATPDALRGVRALLVEDNEEVARATVAVLETMGCVVRLLPSAEQAETLLRTRAGVFDVLLSDIAMSGAIDGIELAIRSLVAHPDLPVLLMTGYSDSMQRAADLGLEVLPKPCAPAVLAQAIQTAIARKRAQLEAA
jgi:signal transduction histidine kinase/ActR/RegA family two-component response regulator